MVWPDSWYYNDFSNPTVTFTQDNNFVMSHQVKTPGGNALNITRFDKDGNSIWSRNYSQLNRHKVYNIHTQDSGVYMLGTVDKPRSNYTSFKGTFILKADNQGKIIQTASGPCLPDDRPFNKTPVTVNEVDSRVDSVVNLNQYSITPATMSTDNIFYDATLFCNQVAFCSSMSLEGDSSSCSLQDTLVYYVTNNSCGAATKWIYDTTMFSLVTKMGDTLKLYPLRSGASIVKAEIESPCFTIAKTIPVSVLISASQLDLGMDTTICPGDTIILNAGPGYSTYLWNNSINDSILTITVPGTYYVKVTDFCGGFGTDTIHISGINSIFDLTGPDVLCKNDTIRIVATPGFLQYQWSPNVNISYSDNIANVHPLLTTEYHVQAAISSGCIVKDSLLITVNTSPAISVGNDTTLCYDQSIQLFAPGGFSSYQWSNGDQSSSTLVQNQGTYFVAAAYSNGCISKDTIVIGKYNFIKPSLGADRPVCDNYFLSAGSYQNYEWNDLSSGSSITINQQGMYWVEITDANGCKGRDTVIITGINAPPSNFLKPVDSLCKYETLQLAPVNNYSAYNWSTGSSQNIITIDKGGLYILTVRDANGCTGKDSIQVFEKNCITGVRIPTAFTPNRDQLNDLFRAKVFGVTEQFSLQVYDRWGNLVFSTTDPAAGWDGKVNGIPAATGVFVWYCTYKLVAEEPGSQKGTVTLIR
jgi:gliding motility-associated-like protein